MENLYSGDVAFSVSHLFYKLCNNSNVLVGNLDALSVDCDLVICPLHISVTYKVFLKMSYFYYFYFYHIWTVSPCVLHK